jgi:cellulose synthase/poly-beta-1,6-N-acetylglucosamine synthase-like glycosyltransferase
VAEVGYRDAARAREGGWPRSRRNLVVWQPASGPIFISGRTTLRPLRPRLLVPLLGAADRVLVATLTIGWLAGLALFWYWLLRPEHRLTLPGLIVNCVLLLYLSVMPSYFLLAVNRLRGVEESLEVPRLRVALVTTKAPSEPWDVAARTLEAMLDQRYPHPYDVWLCDEDPSAEILGWCAERGVKVSTRRNLQEYHRAQWPRRTRCKEGNLAYFYDRWGYRDYDVVAQLDCDHVPASTYLEEMVRPFVDPAIGYVAAPSVCDTNAEESWSARGRLFAEASFHGPLQAGHHGIAPVCIGSHYAVRTSALQQIGGIGPELAEDFSTTFLLTSAGWQGAFAHRAEAHGEGPHTFAAMVTQEFQWARSLVSVLLRLAPRHLRRMPWRMRCRFVFALSYYPLFAMMTGLGLLLPPVAAVSGAGWLSVNYFEFLARWSVLTICLFAIHQLLRARGLLRPARPPVLSWEISLFVLAKWPYVARGVLAAVRQAIRPRPVDFRVTPKVRDGLEPLPARLVLPYLLISTLLSTAAIVGEFSTDTAGYIFLSLLGATMYAIVSLAVPLLHAREAARTALLPFGFAIRRTAGLPVLLGLLALVPLAAGAAIYPSYAMTVFGW